MYEAGDCANPARAVGNSTVPSTPRDEAASHTGDEKAGLTIKQQMQQIMPLSICFALSVAMGNLWLAFGG